MSARSRDAPALMREQRTPRAWLLPGVSGLCLLGTVTALRPVLRDGGLGGVAASLATATATGIALATLVAFVRWGAAHLWTDTAPPDSRAVAAGLATSVGAGLVLPAAAWLGMPPPLAAVAACAAAAATFRTTRARAIAARGSLADEVLGLYHPVQIEEFVEARRAELDDPLTADRDVVRVTLASGMAMLARFTGRPELLPAALRELQHSRHAVHVAWVINAVLDVVPPITAVAAESGHGELLEEAVDLVAEVTAAASTALPAAQIMLRSARAEGLRVLRAIAEDADDRPRAARLHDAAIDELQRALELTRRGSRVRAFRTLELAAANWNRPSGGGIDGAIRACRRSLWRLRLRWRPSRAAWWESGCLTLVEMLGERALHSDERQANADLAEAVRICELVARKGRHPHLALVWLPVFHEELKADAAVIASAFRRAFAPCAARSLADAVDVAADWAVWAVDHSSTEEAAEAHWCLTRALLCRSRQERLSAEAEPRLSDTQTLAAQAGYWLLEAGRARDAAVAMDHGRARQLSERLHEPRERRLEERLEEAQRFDLRDRWLQAIAETVPARRRGDDRRVEPIGRRTVRVGRQRFALAFGPDDPAALAAHERLLREIGRLPGFVDVDVAATYEDLREAAQDGPLVYLAATPQGGFAVVVSGDGPEPVVVRLPRMTSLEARRSVRDLTSVRPAGEGAGELGDALRWIARDVLAPLAQAFEPGALVTLMPIGELNLLPLHAAGLERASTGAVFRYAPFARALLRAQVAARGLGGPELRLLSVAGARPIGDEPAVDACRPVAELFGRTGVAPAPAVTSTDAMLRSIDDAPIWHLACAADHEPILPLTSALVLADGWLGLRTLRAHEHPTQRLAFVATCRAAAPDDDVLDEGVRLAIALLDCGVAGVVAPDGMVAPRAARLLALRFFSLYLDGLAPPRALAAAQAWLATATNGEVSDAFGDLHPSPPGERSADRRRWRSARAFPDPRDWALYSYAGA